MTKNGVHEWRTRWRGAAPLSITREQVSGENGQARARHAGPSSPYQALAFIIGSQEPCQGFKQEKAMARLKVTLAALVHRTD